MNKFCDFIFNVQMFITNVILIIKGCKILHEHGKTIFGEIKGELIDWKNNRNEYQNFYSK